MNLEQAIDSMATGFAVSLETIEPRPEAVAVIERLGARMAKEPSETRRKSLVELVNHYNPGGRWIRDPKIVAALLRGGAARADKARTAALQLLVSKATTDALGPSHTEILRALQVRPTPEALLLVARAKPSGALAAVQAVAASDAAAKGLVEWKVALAANGDRGRETAFLQAFASATDPQEKQRLAGILGNIGTRAALRALAEDMRTPLVYRLGRVFQEPVWIDIAKALVVNFPDRNLPLAPNFAGEYLVYEAFCQKEFGIRWKVERPPFESAGPLEEGFSPVPQ